MSLLHEKYCCTNIRTITGSFKTLKSFPSTIITDNKTRRFVINV